MGGRNGTLVQALLSLPGGPKTPIIPPPPSALDPLNFTNNGLIIVDSPATLAFKAEIKEYSGNGVVFAGGEWDLNGGDLRIEVTSIDVNAALADLGAGAPDFEPFVTHNRAAIRLASGSNFDIDYTLLDGSTTSRALEQTLKVNQGRLELDNRDFLTANAFTNDGSQAPFATNTGPIQTRATPSGPLFFRDPILGNEGQLIVDASIFSAPGFTNLAGTTTVSNGGLLQSTNGEYRINGGRIDVDATSNLSGIDRATGAVLAGTTLTISDFNKQLAGGGESRQSGELRIAGAAPDGLLALIENSGSVTLSGPGAVFRNLEFLQRNFGDLSLLDAASLTLRSANGLENEGNITVGNGGLLDVNGAFTQRNAGLITIETQGTFIATALNLLGTQQTIANQGRLAVNSLQIGNGNVLKGNGQVLGDVTIGAGGVIAPGNSPGTLSVLGSLVFDAGSTLEAEINGVSPGDFDRLLVDGNLQAGGTLQLMFGTSFSPIVNLGLALIEVNPSFENGIQTPGTGVLSGSFNDIVVSGLTGFENSPSASARFVNFAPDGLFLGALGELDLFAFFNTPLLSNGLALAFLDGQGQVQLLQSVPEPRTVLLLFLGIALIWLKLPWNTRGTARDRC